LAIAARPELKFDKAEVIASTAALLAAMKLLDDCWLLFHHAWSCCQNDCVPPICMVDPPDAQAKPGWLMDRSRGPHQASKSTAVLEEFASEVLALFASKLVAAAAFELLAALEEELDEADDVALLSLREEGDTAEVSNALIWALTRLRAF
jgi:hypothetical protein